MALHQVGFSQPDVTVNIEGIVRFSRKFRYAVGKRIGNTVGIALNKRIKCIFFYANSNCGVEILLELAGSDTISSSSEKGTIFNLKLKFFRV